MQKIIIKPVVLPGNEPYTPKGQAERTLQKIRDQNWSPEKIQSTLGELVGIHGDAVAPFIPAIITTNSGASYELALEK